MNLNKISYLIIYLLLIPTFSFASHINNEAKLWQAYDLDGKARSILKFYTINGELRADIFKLTCNSEKYCKKCNGELKNKPFIGMTIIKGLHFEKNKWVNGKVLDTDSGKIYNCNISISKDGNTMKLHAFKGIPVFGRTIKWRRVSASQ